MKYMWGTRDVLDVKAVGNTRKYIQLDHRYLHML